MHFFAPWCTFFLHLGALCLHLGAPFCTSFAPWCTFCTLVHFFCTLVHLFCTSVHLFLYLGAPFLHLSAPFLHLGKKLSEISWDTLYILTFHVLPFLHCYFDISMFVWIVVDYHIKQVRAAFIHLLLPFGNIGRD